MKLFYDSYKFLENHPIFKGEFKSGLDVIPTYDDESDTYSILIETSYYVENDGSNPYNSNEFMLMYNPEIDVWDETFEQAIIKLSNVIRETFGEYTEYESEISKYELLYGKSKAKTTYESHQVRLDLPFGSGK